MSQPKLARKWDKASRTYDLITFGEKLRDAGVKRRLFSKVRGRTLLVAVGTGTDLRHLPAGAEVVGIDVSPAMLERAKQMVPACPARVELELADVEKLRFPPASFDTVLTVCTFCSVPNPVRGLRELLRVLRAGGRLLMYEHVRSNIGPVGFMQDLMTYVTRRFGPDLNRNTVANVKRAGFRLLREENVYLDFVKLIEAEKPAGAGLSLEGEGVDA